MSGSAEFSVFKTRLGWAAVVTGARGILRVYLPESRVRGLQERIERDEPSAVRGPSDPDLAAALRRYFGGERVDFGPFRPDFAGRSDFERAVYRTVRGIGWGRTRTYGEVACRIGRPGAARAVGRAMTRNSWPVVVPCHRVVGAGGRLVGFGAPGGLELKRRLIDMEARAPGARRAPVTRGSPRQPRRSP
jgi:methylated-DNA-[protein]-cysteine S-methyltransferase